MLTRGIRQVRLPQRIDAMATNRQASASVASEDRRQRRAASNKAGRLAAGIGRLHVGERQLIGSVLAAGFAACSLDHGGRRSPPRDEKVRAHAPGVVGRGFAAAVVAGARRARRCIELPLTAAERRAQRSGSPDRGMEVGRGRARCRA